MVETQCAKSVKINAKESNSAGYASDNSKVNVIRPNQTEEMAALQHVFQVY